MVDLRQVFNRGNFSTGHLSKEPNRNLVYKEKPNNMGIYVGNVSHYNPQKGYITLNLNASLAIGDSITFEHENTKYKVSELMFQKQNIPFACHNEQITVGRMKGNIKPGDKIFKIANKKLSDATKLTYSGKEIKKIGLNCLITIKKNTPISISITPNQKYENYRNIYVNLTSNLLPQEAINHPITKEKIIAQFSKTNDTPFVFEKIEVDLDEHLYLPKLSEVNALRRESLKRLEESVIQKFVRPPVRIKEKHFIKHPSSSNPKFSLLLSELNPTFQYHDLEHVDRVYIPYRCFRDSKNKDVIKTITSLFDTYIYLPGVIHANFLNLFDAYITSFLTKYRIKGFVFSNIGEFHFIKDNQKYKDYDFIANYTLNAFNNYSMDSLAKNGIGTITLSPELNRYDLQKMASIINKELIVYGKLKVMTSKYCFLGSSNSCYPTCDGKCRNGEHDYFLRDRMGFKFKVIPHNLESLSSIYHSKNLSIAYDDLDVDYVRIDILKETISEINHIIQTVKAGDHFEGSEYTTGNLNRCV